MGRRRPQVSADGWSTIPGRHVPNIGRPDRGFDPDDPLINYDKHSLSYLSASFSSLHVSSPPSIERVERCCKEVRDCAALAPVFAVAREHLRDRVSCIVVVGLGSLTGTSCTSSYLQLALALEVRQVLIQHLGTKDAIEQADVMEILLQDPVFTDGDIRLLNRLPRVRVVPFTTKEATHLLVEANTLVFAPHLDYLALLKILEAGPLATFCNDLSNYLDRGIGRDLEAEHGILRGLLDETRFGIHVLKDVDGKNSIGNGHAFNNSAFYWRLALSEEEKSKEEEGTSTPPTSSAL